MEGHFDHGKKVLENHSLIITKKVNYDTKSRNDELLRHSYDL